jgi:hypothetical protein
MKRIWLMMIGAVALSFTPMANAGGYACGGYYGGGWGGCYRGGGCYSGGWFGGIGLGLYGGGCGWGFSLGLGLPGLWAGFGLGGYGPVCTTPTCVAPAYTAATYPAPSEVQPANLPVQPGLSAAQMAGHNTRNWTPPPGPITGPTYFWTAPPNTASYSGDSR